ncbi:MAG: class I SAM-dependent methyltransferase [Acidobacteriota bacterium]
MSIRFASLPCWFALAVAGSAQSLPQIRQILDRYAQAAGGKKAWQQVQTIRRQGVALPGSGDLPLETAARVPGKWWLTLKLPDGKVLSHAADGARAWESSPAPKSMGAEEWLEESLLYNPFLVRELRDYFPSMTVKAKERNGEREVWVVEAVPAQGRARTLYFDVKTGLLTRAGKIMLGDYRAVGSIKVPFLVRYGWQTLRYAKVSLDSPVEMALFRAPEMPAPAPSENLPSVASIVDRYLAAIGGEEAVRKIQTQTRKGTGREGSESFEVETVAKSPGKWLLLFRVGGQVVDKQVGNEKAAWSERGGTTKDLNIHSRAESESLFELGLPLSLKNSAGAMAVTRREKRGGREVYVVESEAAQGRRRTLRFDTETGLLESIDNTSFSEYRVVNEVKTPSKIALQDGHVTVEFTEIKHNVPIDDAMFRRPAGSPEYEKVFAGLEGGEAVALLRQAFGQGVTPSDGRMLYDLIVEKGYKRALDVGTARGYSSLWFALAMKKTGGKVVTIEIDPEVADEARANFRKASLEGIIDCRINDAMDEIPGIKGGFDFVFLDPGAPLNQKLFDLLSGKIARGGAIAAHNASSFQSRQPDFLKTIQSDPNLDTKIVPTPSGGISISIRKN